MAGVPSSRGCNACRIAKKKCDQASPMCGRCTRLKLRCVGGGFKRYLFKSENPQQSGGRPGRPAPTTASPTPVLSSTPKIASELVHILEAQDLRYDLCTYGHFVIDLPRRVGSSPVLDASLAAFVASFNSLHYKQSRPQALALYGEALRALRSSLGDSAQSLTADNLCAIYLMSIFQFWIDSEHYKATKHSEMLTHLLRELAAKGPSKQFGSDLLLILCSTVVIESFTNTKIKLGPWFWSLLKIQGSRRPLRGGGNQMFTAITLESISDVSFFIRSPGQYLSQIRCTYDILQLEYPRLREAVREASKASVAQEATIMAKRVGHRFLVTYGVLLSLATLLNRLLRIYDNEPSLLVSAFDFRTEAVWLGEMANANRPLAASFAPEALKIVRAATSDMGLCPKVEELILAYQQDFEGAQYLQESGWIQERFEAMEQRQVRHEFGLVDLVNGSLVEHGGCIIL